MPKLVHCTSTAKAEEVKQALAETAYRLFREKGFDQVGVRDITAAVGVTTGAFYYHFKNKSELLDYHAKKNGLWLMEEVPKLLAGLPPLEQIKKLLGTYLCNIFVADGYELCEDRMFLQHFARRESPGLRERVTELVRACQQEGTLTNNVSAEEIARRVLIAYRGVEYDWCIHQGDYDIHSLMAEQVTVVLTYYKCEKE